MVKKNISNKVDNYLLVYALEMIRDCNTLDSLYDKFLECVKDKLSFDRVRIYILSKDKKFIYGRKSIGKDIDQDIFTKLKVKVDDDKVIRDIIFNGEKKIFEPKNVRKKKNSNYDTKFAAVPMYVNEKISGMVIADNKVSNKEITDYDLERLDLLTSILCVSINTINSKNDYNKKINILNNLTEIATTINKVHGLSEILDFVTIKIIKILDVLECNVYLYDKDNKKLNIETSYSLKKNFLPSKQILLKDSRQYLWSIQNKKINYIEDVSKLFPIKDKLLYENKKRSFLIIPLVFENQVLGVIGIRLQKIEKFNQNMSKIISGISNQVAIAIRNSILYKSLKEKINESKLLNKINNSIVKTTNLFESIDLLKNHLKKFHNAVVNVIYINKNYLISDNGKSKISSKSVYGEVIQTKKIKFLENSKDQSKIFEKSIKSNIYSQNKDKKINIQLKKSDNGFNSDKNGNDTNDFSLVSSKNMIILIPILEHKKCIAIIEVFENGVSSERFNFYNNLNDALRILSHAKDLYRDIKTKNLELESINQNLDNKVHSLNIIQMLSKNISDIKNPKKIIESFFSYIKQIYPEEKVGIFFIEKSFPFFADEGYNFEVMLKKAKEMNYHYGICGQVFKTGKSIVCNNVLKNKYYVSLFKETFSQMTIPIIIRKKVIGVVTIESSIKDKFKDQDRINTLKILTEQIAISLDNYILIERLETKSEVLKKRIRELFTLSKITKNIKKTFDIDDTLKFITDSIVKGLNFDYSSIKLFDTRKKELVLHSFSTSKALEKSFGKYSDNIPLLYKSTDRLIVDNIYKIDEDHISISDIHKKYGTLKSFLSSKNKKYELFFNSNNNSNNDSDNDSNNNSNKTNDDMNSIKSNGENILNEDMKNNINKTDNNFLNNVSEKYYHNSKLNSNFLNLRDSRRLSNLLKSKIHMINKIIFLIRDEDRFYGTLSVGLLYPEEIQENETRILSDIANQTLIALKDARRIQEINNFNTKMKEEVEIKTRELQVINTQLLNEKDKIRNIINLMADSLIVVNNNKKIILVNNAFEKLFGINRDNLVRFDMDFEKILDYFNAKKIVSKNSSIYFEEYYLEKIKKFINIKKTDLMDKKEDIGDIYVIEDITKIKEINTMKTEFVSNVSHELRTPLTSILGYTKLLMSDRLGKLSDLQKDSLKIIDQESERLTRLINDVLDISKLEAGKVNFDFKPGNIKTLVEEVANTFKTISEDRNISFKIIFGSNLPTVAIFDYDRLKQVYINLINNAFKFTDNGGKVSVVVKSKDGYIISLITDTGTGISKSDISKLFNKFYQVDSSMTRKQSGSGLGLAISKEIIDKHHGTIEVESELGKGSTFKFKIPMIANKLSNEKN